MHGGGGAGRRLTGLRTGSQDVREGILGKNHASTELLPCAKLRAAIREVIICDQRIAGFVEAGNLPARR